MVLAIYKKTVQWGESDTPSTHRDAVRQTCHQEGKGRPNTACSLRHGE